MIILVGYILVGAVMLSIMLADEGVRDDISEMSPREQFRYASFVLAAWPLLLLP